MRLKLPPSSYKLLPRYIGPFSVGKQVGKYAYKLTLPAAMRVHPVCHENLLPDLALLMARCMRPPPLFYHDSLLFYESGRTVLKHRTIREGKRVVTQYLLKWAGYIT